MQMTNIKIKKIHKKSAKVRKGLMRIEKRLRQEISEGLQLPKLFSFDWLDLIFIVLCLLTISRFWQISPQRFITDEKAEILVNGAHGYLPYVIVGMILFLVSIVIDYFALKRKNKTEKESTTSGNEKFLPLYRLPYKKLKKEESNSEKIWFTFRFAERKYTVSLGIMLLLVFISDALILFLVYIVVGKFYAVTEVEGILFALMSGAAEELLFRGGIATCFLAIVHLSTGIKKLPKVAEIVVIIIISIIVGYLFGYAHEYYRLSEDPKLISYYYASIFTGMMYTFIYLYSKSLFITTIAHVVHNMLVQGTLLQG